MAHSYDPYENVRNVMSDRRKMAGIDSPYMGNYQMSTA